ncbi:MAG: hypothetical protein D3904_11495, partial [Candidatus Electrothrix sp. EH2]|nr:hypothetical protein [Candidatus Electrothrix sp. EH2]
MFLTYVREAVRSLYTAKQRTLLALIGISIAIGAVIALVSIGIIWGEESLKRFSELGPDILQIEAPWSRRDDEGITVQDAFLLLDSSQTLADVVPMITNYGGYFFGGENDWTMITGTTVKYQKMNRLRIKSGRFISILDESKPYVVIGTRLLNKPGLKKFTGSLIGSTVKLENKPYTIIGTLEESANDWHANFSVIIPISTAIRSFGKKNISKITARMKPGVDFRIATKEIQQYFKQRKNVEVTVNANVQAIKSAQEQASMLTSLLGLISSISLLVGGVGIMNV